IEFVVEPEFVCEGDEVPTRRLQFHRVSKTVIRIWDLARVVDDRVLVCGIHNFDADCTPNGPYIRSERRENVVVRMGNQSSSGLKYSVLGGKGATPDVKATVSRDRRRDIRGGTLQSPAYKTMN
ncbi:hypothetical protein FOZ63_021980, partial [Perkinsus olseni]